MIRDIVVAILIVSAAIYMDILIRESSALETVLRPYEGLNYDEIQSYSYPDDKECECYCLEDMD